MIEYHRGLLVDDLRTRTYREAIHRIVQPGHVVIDLGCGSGVLSFFACEAGASKVYAIEQSHMADVTRLLVKRAGLEARIEVLHDESSVLELPQRADVLVTETIGAFAYDESILASVIDARRRLLHPNARILPERLALFAAPAEIPREYDETVAWWSERRYGVDFTPLRVFASNTLHRFHVSEEARLAEGEELMNVELATVESAQLEGRASFKARRDGLVHGFAVWFTATLAEGLELTSRAERGTHWSQGFLPLEVPIGVTRGTRIKLELETDDGRGWGWRGDIDGTAFDQTNGFSMPPCGLARRRSPEE